MAFQHRTGVTKRATKTLCAKQHTRLRVFQKKKVCWCDGGGTSSGLCRFYPLSFSSCEHDTTDKNRPPGPWNSRARQTDNILSQFNCRSGALLSVRRGVCSSLRFRLATPLAMAGTAVSPEGQPGLRTFIDGKPDGPTIVFVHGWPDDHALWDKQVSLKRASA